MVGDGIHRRDVLRGGIVLGGTIGIAGCMRNLSENEEETTTGQGDVDGASFFFSYQPDSQSLSIQYEGGGQLMAKQVEIQTLGGHSTTWNQLGSTNSQANVTLSEGTRARLGQNVLNWGREVNRSITVRIVYRLEDGSPTTLATFSPEKLSTSTAEETEEESTTTTSADPDGLYDGFENGSLNDPDWNIAESGGSIETVTEGFEGSRSLQLTDPGNGDQEKVIRCNQIWLPISRSIPEGTTFSTWTKTDAIGPPDHRVYQIGEGGGFGNGTFAAIRFRKGRVQINGDAITAKDLTSEVSPNTWYKFQMMVLGDGGVEFSVLDSNEQEIVSRSLQASNSSAYDRVQLWSGDITSQSVSVWFDKVRYSV